ncbi:MAG TPA: Holliday junction branch migration protein RuvA [Parachlamydiaceae bacterium]|nr:Holliday junction branch migration protein RuvA [Parachlamydiaceae bacterium]
MFAYLKGILTLSTPISVVMEVNGIGYKLFIPASACSQLPQIGSALTLHTAFVVRELSQTLYGFFSMQERDFFEALLGVTGIGPKIALALIGHMSLNELQRAISNSDTVTLCRIPGIGKKGAERLIIEMRDKVDASSLHDGLSAHYVADPHTQTVNDAVSALINLGYNQNIAQKAIKKSLKDIPEAIDVGALISLALKNI